MRPSPCAAELRETSFALWSPPGPDKAKGGGAGGIRTLDRALQPYNGLANRRLQPLGHVSSKADMPDTRACRKRQIWGRRVLRWIEPSGGEQYGLARGDLRAKQVIRRTNRRRSIALYRVSSPKAASADRIPSRFVHMPRHRSVARASQTRRGFGNADCRNFLPSCADAPPRDHRDA